MMVRASRPFSSGCCVSQKFWCVFNRWREKSDLPRDHARQAPFKGGLFHRGVHQGVPQTERCQAGPRRGQQVAVPVRSVDFIDSAGRRLSFVLDNGTKTNTDPVTTITESELKDLI